MIKHYFKLKTWLILFLIIIFSVSISLLIIVYQFNCQVNITQAGTDQNIVGFAWSSSFGWISFNSTDTGSAVNYGVNINLASGNFSGYAWSPNIGWIDFAPNGPYPPIGPAYSARYDSGNLTGWAKVLSLGNNGWLRFENASMAADGKFLGWMWNANEDGSGIGWVSLNSASAGSGISHAVGIMPPNKPTNVIVARNLSFPDSILDVSWNNVGAIHYYIYYKKNIDPTYQKYDPSNNGGEIFTTSGLVAGLISGTAYNFIIKACNAFTCVDSSDPANGTTNSVSQPSNDDINGIGQCPDIINLTWAATAGADYYIISRCNKEGSSCNDGVGTANTNSYSDQVPDGAVKHTYKITGCNNDPAECGATSTPSKAFLACPSLPTWKEIKGL